MQSLKNAQSIKMKAFVLFYCILIWEVTFLIECTTARHRRDEMWIAHARCECARAL